MRRCVELSVTELSRRSAKYLDEVDSCVRATETNVLGMRKIVKRYSRLPADNQHTEMLKKLLNKVRFVIHARKYNVIGCDYRANGQQTYCKEIRDIAKIGYFFRPNLYLYLAVGLYPLGGNFTHWGNSAAILPRSFASKN